MGLSKGTLTFTRYRVAGKLPDKFPDFIDRQIKLFAFRELSPGSDEKSLGWTSFDNILDTDFEYANYSLADYIRLFPSHRSPDSAARPAAAGAYSKRKKSSWRKKA